MTTKTDTPGPTSTIELVTPIELLQTLAPVEKTLQQVADESDRGLQLIRSHQRQREIRRQAIGWG